MRPKLKNIITSILPRPRGMSEEQGLRYAPVLSVIESVRSVTGSHSTHGVFTHHDPGKTSRTVIRAASLRLLPDVHARSIYQLFSLGP